MLLDVAVTALLDQAIDAGSALYYRDRVGVREVMSVLPGLKSVFRWV